MHRLIPAMLSTVLLCGASSAFAADLIEDGRYRQAAPEDGVRSEEPADGYDDGYDDGGGCPACRPEARMLHGDRPSSEGRDIDVMIRNTIVVSEYAFGGAPAYNRLPDGCVCRIAAPNMAAYNPYVAGYLYGYALGTYGYAGSRYAGSGWR